MTPSNFGTKNCSMAERPAILMQRRGSFLAPMSPLDEAAVAELPAAKALRVRITQPRNVGRFRLYWALLTIVHDNMDRPPPLETLHEAVKLRLGLSTPVRFKSGDVVEVPRSIAFDAMEETEFTTFFESFKDLIHASPAMEKAASELLGSD